VAIVVFAVVAVAGLTSVALVVAAIRSERDDERMGRWRASVARERIYGSQARGTQAPAASLVRETEDPGVDDLFI